jgi:hypothetical protein
MKRIRSLIQNLVPGFAVLLVFIGMGITALNVLGALYLVVLFFKHVIFSGR